MALGRVWKSRFRIPVVLDMQDPWVSHYYDGKPHAARPPKYRLAQAMHKILERWTMPGVDGVIAVSEKYHADLQRRYPWIEGSACRTLPFGASPHDHAIAERLNGVNRFFDPSDGLIHGVYTGVLGPVMKQTCAAICRAVRLGLRKCPDLFGKLRLHFVGTDYAPKDAARETIRPIADEMGVAKFVMEHPRRIPYFQALNLLQNADFLIVPGSDNPSYTASKVFPYILAKKPLLAIFHEESSVVRIVRETKAGEVVTFRGDDEMEDLARRVLTAWKSMLRRLPYTPSTDWEHFEPYTAHELTRRQCELFDHIVDGRARVILQSHEQ
jgi:hypothetical protein